MQLLDLFVLIVGLLVVRIILCLFLRWQSGWGKLAALYLKPRDFGENLKEFYMASVYVGRPYLPARYGFSMNVGVYTGGLTFRPIVPFSLFAPKLYLPWSALVAVEEKTPILESFNFRVNEVWPTFAVFGKCGRHCADRWRTNLLDTPRVPS